MLLLALGAALLASSVTAASATMLITGDRGGQIGRYLQTFAQVRSSGERVIVDGKPVLAERRARGRKKLTV